MTCADILNKMLTQELMSVLASPSPSTSDVDAVFEAGLSPLLPLLDANTTSSRKEAALKYLFRIKGQVEGVLWRSLFHRQRFLYGELGGIVMDLASLLHIPLALVASPTLSIRFWNTESHHIVLPSKL